MNLRGTHSMTPPRERSITVNGSRVRIWQKGEGLPLAILCGYGGVPHWSEFAELLAQHRQVLQFSLPGQHGSERGHDLLHTPLDWIVATLEMLERGSPFGQPMDLVAGSVAGMLAGEVAAVAPHLLRSLTLIGPLGLYDSDNPPSSPYAQATFNRPKLLMENQQRYAEAFGPPPDADAAQRREFDVISYRADEAMGRLMWPFGDIKLARRLHRVCTPTLLLWGEKDRIIPPAYAQRYAALIPAGARISMIPNAGHLAQFDAPTECAEIIMDFIGNVGAGVEVAATVRSAI